MSETSLKDIQENPLPIETQEATPGNPDIFWGIKMIAIFLGFIALSYAIFFVFSRGAMLFFDLENERKYFGEFFLEGEKIESFTGGMLSYQLPEEIIQDIYIMESEEVNAFATIGAKMLITTEMFKTVENQEELIFVIGHEMTHQQNQDALRSFLIHAPFSLSMMMMGFESMFSETNASDLLVKYIDRNIESEAEVGGIELLQKLGLNSKCATGIFESNIHKSDKYLKFLSTHPVNQDRVDFIQSQAGDFGEKECTEMIYRGAKDQEL